MCVACIIIPIAILIIFITIFLFVILIIWFWFFQRIRNVQKSKSSPVKGIVLKKIEEVEKKDENLYSNTVAKESLDISNAGNVSIQV